ncbi:FAD-binding domain-containing protein [Palleronia sp. KMU-117]|uniref:FAD-binding domain-containing protein n=1 Tax=Palleronia sp. KMU-117 TaxID=3434108 RepID=UPI003D72B4BD
MTRPDHPPDHPPRRDEGLRRLRDFVPRAGRAYAAGRNHDRPGHPDVSVLSPYIRHRLISEDEVLRAVLGRHSPAAAEKFVQEVFWRTYWKGWLEMRPGVWTAYRAELSRALDRIATEGGLRRDWEAACRGETGIDCFDHWARELVETGYLHNHARMWTASIWIFTLRLPWVLGADFFLRHLLDGDAASNTLSWRWVAGLQTPGKHYIARAENIARHTGGRFDPRGQLDEAPRPLEGPPPPPRQPIAPGGWPDPARRTGIVLTEDDLSPGFAVAGLQVAATLVVPGVGSRSPLAVAPRVESFTRGAIADALSRHAAQLGEVTVLEAAEPSALSDWARAQNLDQIVLPHVPTGPAADRLAPLLAEARGRGLDVVRVLRPYDAAAWPHATAGFFRFREAIPRLIDDLGLAPGGMR